MRKAARAGIFCPMPLLFAKSYFGLFQTEAKARGLIMEIDRVMATLRSLWMNARSSTEKEKWRSRIDQALDERLRLMRIRDAASATA